MGFNEPVNSASYIIFKDTIGATDYYFAQNGKTGEIESYDTDASTVIQYAIDQLYNEYTSRTGSTGGINAVYGVIDGSNELYYLSSGIIHKPGVHMRNFRLNGEGMSSGAIYTVENPDAGTPVQNVLLENIQAIKGPEAGFILKDMVASRVLQCVAYGCHDYGFYIQSCHTCYFDMIYAEGIAGGSPADGIKTEANGNTGAAVNNNLFNRVRVHSCDGYGIMTEYDGGASRGNTFINPDAESCGKDGMFFGSLMTTIINPWAESNAVNGIKIGEGAAGSILNGGYYTSNGDNSLRVIGDMTTLIGVMLGSGKSIKIEGDEIHAINCELSGTVTITGTRFIQNGLGENNGDPSLTGEWYGHGKEGIRVVDTNTGAIYEYSNGAWRMVSPGTTKNSGTAIFSGNGSKTSFNIPHGLAATPTNVRVSSASPDAEGVYSSRYDADATNIVAKFKTAPPSPTVEDSNSGNIDGTSSTISDDGKSWTDDEWIGHYVRITGGTGDEQCRRIIDNDATTLTVSPDWDTIPDSTSTYDIIDSAIEIEWEAEV